MRYLVFLRGVDSPHKRAVVQYLLRELNPNASTVRAFLTGLRHRMDPTGDIRAASRSVKNLLHRMFIHHHEPLILIDSESLRPTDWNSLIKIANLHVSEVGIIGVDIIQENFNTGIDSKRLNLQARFRDMFIAISPKYLECSSDDAMAEAQRIASMLKEIVDC